MTTEVIEKKQSNRKGNPLMKALTDEHFTDSIEFAYQKLDLLFSRVSPELYQNAGFWKGYIEWCKNTEKRELLKTQQQKVNQLVSMGFSEQEAKELVSKL